MDEIVEEFLVECHEAIDKMDSDLVLLEENPKDKALLDRILRVAHSIKGTCGFLGFDKLEAIAHVGETLVIHLRDGTIEMSEEIASALLASVDAYREIVLHIEKDETEGDKNYQELIDTLDALSNPAAAPKTPEPQSTAAPNAPIQDTPETSPTEITKEQTVTKDKPSLIAESSLNTQSSPQKEIAESSIRVDVGLLDTLMNLVGELVLSRNQILQYTNEQSTLDPALMRASQRLNLITTELQEGVMKTRMQPIGSIWSKFPRIVRDLSLSCNKQVKVEMEGRETELDKTILEAIKDPLTHVLRNSVDHGIETPEERKAAGKPEQGTLFLRAYHESGQVNIEICDDGKGIDPTKVSNKALEKGLISTEDLRHMSEREILNLIFMPGFSTAAQVTNISGRGVGMDVVKTNIEKIGGSVDIQSVLGHGTTLKLRIPLTLAIIPALTVTSAGERFAIPQVNLLELVRLEEAELEDKIEYIHNAPVYRLREHLLPLVYLNKQLELEDIQLGEDEERVLNIVVLNAEDQHFGLIVDEINDTQEIVVKPLGKQLKDVKVLAGATIMGDGKVALILDALGIAEQSGVLCKTREFEKSNRREETTTVGLDRQSLLLFSVGENTRFAIPLSQVARLEELNIDNIEHSGDSEVVQYRGEIMPLVHLSRYVKSGGCVEAGENGLPVIVYKDQSRSFGLIVENILDIVEESVNLSKVKEDPFILGAAVVSDQVTDFLNVEAIINRSLM